MSHDANRAELVDWLLTEGFTEKQIADSFAPMLLPARRALGDDGTLLSARQISAQTGMDLGDLQRFLHAAGRPRSEDPDAALYLPLDARLVGYTQQALNVGLREDELVGVVQVMAEGLTRTVEVMRHAVLAAVLRPGVSELEGAKASGAITAEVAPFLGPLIQDMLRTQLLHAMQDEEVGTTERLAGRPLPGSGQVSIAFADLVGFTSLGEELPPEELERMAHRLSDLARDLAQSPVRFVKSIGDAVMLVSAEPVPLLQTVLRLVAAADADDALPRLKAGMATGMAVSRAGDWFGSPVNQASRVTGVARPGAVLLSESARDAVAEAPGFTWSFAGARKLKGIRDEVKLYRARRAAD